MGQVFSWWLVIEIVGLVGMPLASVICANLPDYGWALSKPLGILIVGWLIWFPLSIITALPYSAAWITGTFLVFALLNLVLLRETRIKSNLYHLIRSRPLYIATSEAVFTVGFLLLAWIRSFNPAVAATEKFMDVAFLSSLIRTQHLPPPDPWFSGASINYYYFGHFLLASVAKVLGTQPGTAFNLGIAVIFGLVATAVFGVSTNLAATLRADKNVSRVLPFGLFSVLLVLVLGDLNGAQLWWQQAVAWTHTLAGQGQSPLAWLLHRNLWPSFNLYWEPSRVIPGTINEFPAFSFLLSDLHAHVLALPFDVLAVGLALNLILGRGRGTRVFGTGRAAVYTVAGTGIVIGSLYAMNGWDLPTYLGLAVLALACQQWRAHDCQFDREFLLDLLVPALLLVALTFLLFLPFYREFVSPSQGFGVVPSTDRSPIGDEFSIFGLPLFLAASLLFVWGVNRLSPLFPGEFSAPASWWPFSRSAPPPVSAKLAAGVAIGVVLAILLVLTLRNPQAPDWTLFWCLVVLGACTVLALGHVVGIEAAVSADDNRKGAELFILILIGTSAALVGACELVFVRDIFQDRMNTVFKLYYQAWLLLGICGGPALMLLLAGVWQKLVSALTLLDTEPTMLEAAEFTRSTVRIRSSKPGSTPALPFRSSASSVTVSSTVTVSSSAAGAGAPGDRAGRDILSSPLRSLGAAGSLVWLGILGLLVAAALIYPVLASSWVTNNFTLAPGTQAALDGTAFMASQPADACTLCASCAPYAGTDVNDNQAILWLNTHVQGSPVLLEAPGCEWSYYSRISAFTGLPTLIGWPGGHEGEWRSNWLLEQHLGDVVDLRAEVANNIYTNPNQGTDLALLRQYHVRYVYVGQLERNLYKGAELDRFKQFLRPIYNRDGVTIYAVP